MQDLPEFTGDGLIEFTGADGRVLSQEEIDKMYDEIPEEEKKRFFEENSSPDEISTEQLEQLLFDVLLNEKQTKSK